MAKLTYKGVERDIRIDEGTLFRFEKAGGSLPALSKQPAYQSAMLLCIALGLKGDPETHLKDLPGLKVRNEVLAEALKESGVITEDEAGMVNPPDGTTSGQQH